MSRQLPPKPHLDSLKKQARQLLKGYQSGQDEAAKRVKAVLSELPPSATEELTLRHAQQVVAREYGFTSWQKLVEQVGRPAGEDEPRPSYLSHYDKMAQDLIEALRTDREEAFGRRKQAIWQRLKKVLPRFAEASREEILKAELPLEEARLVIARENDFESWEALDVVVTEYASDGPPMTKDHLRGLERLHGEFARLLAVNFTFSENMERQVDVDTAFVDQLSYGEFINSLSNPTRAFRFSVDGMDGSVVVDLAMPVVEGLLAARKTGGDESDRLQYFAERIARDFEKAWAPLKKMAVRAFDMQTDPLALKVAPMHEIVGLLAFEANAKPAQTGFWGLVSLCYPVTAIHALLPGLADYGAAEATLAG